MGSKINSTEIPDKFRNSIEKHGIDMNLRSLSAIAKHLGYDSRNFRNRVNRMNFTVLEMMDLFKRLHYTSEEILEIMKI